MSSMSVGDMFKKSKTAAGIKHQLYCKIAIIYEMAATPAIGENVYLATICCIKGFAMNKQLVLSAVVLAVLGTSCSREEAAPDRLSVTGDFELTVSPSVPAIEDENGTKVVFSPESGFSWTGTENASILVGRTGVTTTEAASQKITLASVANGVFSGTVSFKSDFTADDIKGFAIPAEAGAYYRYKNSQDRLIIPISASQTQAVEGELNVINCPFFSQLTADDLIEDGEGRFKVDNVQMHSATDLICFNVYGAVTEGEKLVSVAIKASDRINGTAEWKLGNTSFSSNGGSATTVTLDEPCSLDGREKANGAKVYMGVILGGKRTISSVTVTTDRNVYTKTVSQDLSAKGVNNKTRLFRFGLNLATFDREPLSGNLLLALAPDSPRAALGLKLSDLSGFTLTLGGKELSPKKTAEGEYYLDTLGLKDVQASIEWPDATLSFGDASSENARIPYSQFVGGIASKMQNYPLYASVSGEVGDVLYFRDAFAAVKLSVSGTGAVKSVKISSPDGKKLAADNLDFVVQNCLNSSGEGVSLPADITVPVAPGSFPGGLDIVICGKDNKMVSRHMDITSLAAGQVETISVAYSPAPQLLYYEGFDNFVWGADPAGVRQGYAPDDVDPGISGRTAETGFEDSETPVAAGVAGTGFVTGNTWGNSYTVTSKHQTSTSWVNSRDVWGWRYLFRAQEYQGCISVGTGNQYRGWVNPPVLSGLSAKGTVKLSFRVLAKASATDDIEMTVLNAGSIVKVDRDGTQIYASTGGVTVHTLTSSTVEGSWHTVDYTVIDATSSTEFQIRGSNTTAGVHGWWMDDIRVEKVNTANITAGDVSDIGTDLATVTYAFDLSIDADATEGMVLSLPKGGMISGMKVDGTVRGDDTFGKSRWPMVTTYTISPASLSAGTHRIEFTVESADAGTTFVTSGPYSSDGSPKYSIADEVVTVVDRQRRGNFRLMYWNIQNGMWSDQAASYANFREWIKRYDPDVCVWCEAESIYKTGTSTSAATADRYFPNGWTTFAPTYGHSYAVNGGNRDNYSQEITSKTAITTVTKITDSDVSGKPIQHGAGHFQVSAGGRTLNFVTMHTWPQSYGPGVAEADRAASTAASEGNYYREFEMEYVVKMTVNNASYASQTDWILLGDMNSRSRKDNWYYGYSETSTALLCQDVVLNKTNLKDVVWEWFEGGFVPTTWRGDKRIDYIYTSPGLYSKIKDVRVLTDSWTYQVYSGVDSYYLPSDHKPIIIDFDL